MFAIRMGVPEMNDFWKTLNEKVINHTANKNELKLFKKLLSCFHKLNELLDE